MPMTTEPKMNSTDGSMKSLKAAAGLRMRNRAWRVPINRLVTPMGTTSKIHQVAATANTARAPLAWVLRTKCSPLGSMASGQAGL